jgi:hypothetical protein
MDNEQLRDLALQIKTSYPYALPLATPNLGLIQAVRKKRNGQVALPGDEERPIRSGQRRMKLPWRIA